MNPPVSGEDDYYGSFDIEFRNFWTNGSYYCIFAGMGYLPDRPHARLLYRPDSRLKAREAFARVKEKQASLLAKLPTTYEYLQHLHATHHAASRSPALRISHGQKHAFVSGPERRIEKSEERPYLP